MRLIWLFTLDITCILLPQFNCLSYIEKGMLDRLLTYYDDKVRPADKRNFLADPNSPPIVINATVAIRHMTFKDSVLTLDMELDEAWYDSRLQGSEKVRQRFQLPSDVKVWVPRGAPQTNSKPSECQHRKIYISDTARLESQCRFVVQVDCTGDRINFPFDSYTCRVETEAADSTDVSYLCDGCLEEVNVNVVPPSFTVRSSVKTHSISKSDTYTSLLDSFTSSTTVNPRLKRRKPRKKAGKGIRTAKTTTPAYDVYDYTDQDDEDAAGTMRMAIGRAMTLEIVVTRSATAFYVVTAMIPAVLLVALAWIAVLSHRKTVKVTLQSTAVFALVVLWGNHRDQPTVTSLDLWLLCCLCFICSTILESSVLNWLPSLHRAASRTSVAKRSDSSSSVNRAVYRGDGKGGDANGSLLGHVEQCGDTVKRLVHQERVHMAFVIMYPLLFVIVSLVFWLPRLP